ncbi:MAG TPA: hypothetical protein VGJ62_00470 [Gemmatimonadaceae bacterium]
MKSIDALLTGLIDYAGLFPPASEDMRPALESYAAYLRGSDRKALGRFIVPISRLQELEESGSDLMPRGAKTRPWYLSVLISEDVRAARGEILKFNRRHFSAPSKRGARGVRGAGGGRAVIDVAELKASTVGQIEHQRSDLPTGITAYFEIPSTGDVSPLLKALARVGARAKIRTGGVTPEAFPPAPAIIDFMSACRRETVPFKATAGLHHPVRGEYRLTHDADSKKWMMYGFLNLFIAAVLLYAGESDDTALSDLEESDPSAFTFEEEEIQWRDKRVTVEQIHAARTELAISFGSCSFREPIDELARLTRRAKSTIQ